ncbi:MAG TPA: ferritin-like domain-containing protein [Haliangiales bacterium]|nr:ferritin-like domain-containing protein [Haliangiales bacterium]
MAEHDKLVEILNEAIALEYTAAVQYNQHSMLLTGRDKMLYEDLFQDSAREALAHAKMWGDRIVYLGGVPRAQVGTTRQSTDITEMLEMDLAVEKQAVEIYSRAHKVCKHEPTLYMLENHILDEDKDVEELQKLLGKVRIAEAAAPAEKKVVSARHYGDGGRARASTH